MNTENKTDSSSSDSSGEKMLTEDDLTALREHWPLSAGHVDINELLDHIAALSATIKRLETPVADGEVEELFRDMIWSPILRAKVEEIIARQAGEIERRTGQYEQMRAAMTKALSWLPTDCKAAEVIRAALSLNSVETRS